MYAPVGALVKRPSDDVFFTTFTVTEFSKVATGRARETSVRWWHYYQWNMWRIWWRFCTEYVEDINREFIKIYWRILDIFMGIMDGISGENLEKMWRILNFLGLSLPFVRILVNLVNFWKHLESSTGEKVENMWRKCGENVENMYRICGEYVENMWRI